MRVVHVCAGPQSLRNRIFGGVFFMLSRSVLDFSVGEGFFVI